jgi:hypothetical protein
MLDTSCWMLNPQILGIFPTTFIVLFSFDIKIRLAYIGRDTMDLHVKLNF